MSSRKARFEAQPDEWWDLLGLLASEVEIGANWIVRVHAVWVSETESVFFAEVIESRALAEVSANANLDGDEVHLDYHIYQLFFSTLKCGGKPYPSVNDACLYFCPALFCREDGHGHGRDLGLDLCSDHGLSLDSVLGLYRVPSPCGDLGPWFC